MLNYIKSEIYRNLHNKSNYTFLFGCTIFVIFLNIALAIIKSHDTGFVYAATWYSFSSLDNMMGIPFILTIMISSIVFGQEHKNHTLKNTVAYGLKRKEIYLGKFVILVIVSFINLVVISGAYILTSYLLLENSGAVYLNQLIRSLIACTPLFLFGATLAFCLYFIFDNETAVLGWWVSITIIIPKIIELLSVKVKILRPISKVMPWTIMKDITPADKPHEFIFYWNSNQGLIKCFIIGIIGSLIFYLIGLKRFKKVEIK